MIKTLRILDTILLHPKDLCNIKKSISRIIHDKIGKCYEEYGFIVDVDSIHWSTARNLICRTTSHIKYKLEYTVKTVLPKSGEQYICDITRLTDKGILATVNGVKIIVPSVHIDGYTFHDNSFKCFKTKDILYPQGKIRITIKSACFVGNTYQCLGIFIESISKNTY